MKNIVLFFNCLLSYGRFQQTLKSILNIKQFLNHINLNKELLNIKNQLKSLVKTAIKQFV